MIDLLGRRPFTSKDDMDKWLDEHRKEVKLPPPTEGEVDSPFPDPAPVPAPIAKALDDPRMLRP
jgi:AFG3 family protein